MKLKNFFEQEKRRVIEDCIECGLCVKRCEIIDKSSLNCEENKDIQRAVIAYLKTGNADDISIVQERVKSCMKCYGCLDSCPIDLNPMRTIEICQWEMEEKGHIQYPAWDPKSPELVHRVLASILVDSTDYKRIFNPSEIKKSKTLFFPGCNVYFQPEKILNCLDIMEMVDSDFAYLPGLDNCCGNCHLTRGRPEKAGEAFVKLLASIENYQPETVVLWCPTCFCVADTTFDPLYEYPFTIKSMSQYLAEHTDKLNIKKKNTAKVTIHDACKVALTGLDVDGIRPVLKAIGTEMVEMPRNRENTACCGCAAIVNDPLAGNKMLDERIEEAAETGARTLVTSCHFCSQMLASKQDSTPFKVDNFINMLASSSGIDREDRFKKYMRWADREKIINDAKERIAASPFSEELILKVIAMVFGAH